MVENRAEQTNVQTSSKRSAFWRFVFPCLMVVLFLFPLLLVRPSASHYHEKPIKERRLNMKGLENVTTEYLDTHPGTYEKLIRVVSKADDALQEQEYPPRGAVMFWLKNAMREEGFDEQMTVYFYLKNVYLQEWEGAYLHQVDDGEREYLYDLMGAVMGGMYRCTCAPPEVRQS